MIQPAELKLDLPIAIANGKLSTTQKVWQILFASYKGDVEHVKHLVNQRHELIYAQYNYAPPIHFAVREGHVKLVEYLLKQGAYCPAYRFYPFQESLEMVAHDRGYTEIEQMLKEYAIKPSGQKFGKDNGEIFYDRTPIQQQFEQAVDQNNLVLTADILKQHPEFALDETFFWSEGILAMPVKENHREMIDLLLSYGARVPGLLKWAQYYYFERYDAAEYIMSKGMGPNVMSWQHVTLLHDMAHKGYLDKAALLIKHGADINAIDEAYQSTPLGLAARWGNHEMAGYLLKQGANPSLSGAKWSTPLAWARKKGHAGIAELLLKAGAK